MWKMYWENRSGNIRGSYTMCYSCLWLFRMYWGRCPCVSIWLWCFRVVVGCLNKMVRSPDNSQTDHLDRRIHHSSRWYLFGKRRCTQHKLLAIFNESQTDFRREWLKLKFTCNRHPTIIFARITTCTMLPAIWSWKIISEFEKCQHRLAN